MSDQDLSGCETESEPLQMLANTIDEVFWIADPKISQSIYISPAYDKVWGRPREELKRNPQSFIDAIHPDDREKMRFAFVEQREGRPFEHEYRVIWPDGSIRWIIDRGFPVFDKSGELKVFTGVAKDITDRKKIELELRASESRFRTIFEDAPIGMTIASLDGRVLRANEAFCQFIGYSERELLTMSLKDFTFPDDVASSKAMIARLAAGSPHGFLLEKRYIHRNGNLLWAELTGAAVLDEQGVAQYLIAQVVDITERRRANAELIESRTRLEDLSARREQIREDEKRRIAGEVHDELGQRLTAIKLGLSAMQLKHAGQVELLGAINALEKQVEETMHVVRDIAVNLRPASLDLGLVPALRWLTDTFEQNHDIGCRLDVECPAIVVPEPCTTTLFRIAQESLTNVARHAQAGQARITLAHRQGELRLSISDDGRGFDYANTVRSGQGTGLAGIADRARALGGSVAVSSVSGTGTTVDCAIPCPMQERVP